MNWSWRKDLDLVLNLFLDKYCLKTCFPCGEKMRIPPYCKASKHKYKDSSRRQKLPQIIFGSCRNFYGVRMGHF